MRLPVDSVYYIRQQHFSDFETGLKALNSQNKTMKRLREVYSTCEYVMGLSVNKRKYSKKVNLNEGMRGRLKVSFVPKSAKAVDKCITMPHLHIYIYGFYAASLATEFADIQNTFYQRKNMKIT